MSAHWILEEIVQEMPEVQIVEKVVEVPQVLKQPVEHVVEEIIHVPKVKPFAAEHLCTVYTVYSVYTVYIHIFCMSMSTFVVLVVPIAKLVD